MKIVSLTHKYVEIEWSKGMFKCDHTTKQNKQRLKAVCNSDKMIAMCSERTFLDCDWPRCRQFVDFINKEKYSKATLSNIQGKHCYCSSTSSKAADDWPSVHSHYVFNCLLQHKNMLMTIQEMWNSLCIFIGMYCASLIYVTSI